MTPQTPNVSGPHGSSAQPPSLARVVRLAVARLAPRRIILFGSRARGDHGARSDIDLAFDLDAGQDKAWGAFVAEMTDAAPTLLGVDLVRMDTCSAAIRRSVEQEGVTLYERGKA